MEQNIRTFYNSQTQILRGEIQKNLKKFTMQTNLIDQLIQHLSMVIQFKGLNLNQIQVIIGLLYYSSLLKDNVKNWLKILFLLKQSINLYLKKPNIIISLQLDQLIRDLTKILQGNCYVKLLSFDDKFGNQLFWYFSSHFLESTLEMVYRYYLCLNSARNEDTLMIVNQVISMLNRMIMGK
ncbi:unnamed protein product [Paramecium pentaurelia]|uniref:Uncharacterized protein n=1 Tax=Paramecium pentaurelia TaxID=43138 RepID=A0A8S1VRK8_9CILI|nr:unnamed protein product [Paramecium pentaurelia]